MAYKIHIRVISVRHLLTLYLVTLVMTYQFKRNAYGGHVGLRVLDCCWVNSHMLDETIDVENMEMGI